VIKLLTSLPGVITLNRYLRRRYTGCERPEFALRGSSYSPLPDYEEVQARAEQLFVKKNDLGPSIRLRPDSQQTLIKEIAPFYPEFDWPWQPVSGRRYFLDNQYFCTGDALVLFGLLRKFRPRRIIEVGSGFSSALMLDTNDRFLNGDIELTFIEPDANRLRSILNDHDADRVQLFETAVQEIPLSLFSSLNRNDILFIDSSHVSKIGSDVNYLIFDILPHLRSGVLVHFHDIFWPFEYPIEWIMEGRAWNEAYVVRAFLEYNDAFEILLFNSYLGRSFPELMADLMPQFLENVGGSLWLRKVN
jgi:predicted O-methyltransferase YrrM